MNIAQRLLALAVVSFFGLLAMGGWGIYQMNTINGVTHLINEVTLPSITTVYRMEGRFLRYRTRFLYTIYAPESEVPRHRERMAVNRGELEEAIKQYEPLIEDEKDRQYLETTKRLKQAYFDETAAINEMIKAGQREEGLARLVKAQQLAVSLSENIEAHVHYNVELSKAKEAMATSAYERGMTFSIILALLMMLVTGGLGFLIRKQIIDSLQAMQETMEQISNHLDFTRRVPANSDDEIGQAMKAFNHLLERLQNSFRQIREHTEQVNGAAARVASAARQMSGASTYQSEAASGMAATVEEMTVSINHVAERAGDANNLSADSGRLAHDGGAIIAETVAGINGIASTVQAASGHISRLEQSGERINAVVAVIKEVADQTNLLALNAAIEAARAGEQGRGFAVVADEVRKLAERTTHSTHEIAGTISDMQSGAEAAVTGIQAVVEKVHDGVARAERASRSIQDIEASANQTQDMVADISSAIREQGVASTSIAQQIEKIAQMSEENSAAATSTADTAEELARLANSMQQVVAQYRL